MGSEMCIRDSCIIALQSKILFGVASRFDITVAPVVVIPDILSKKASLNENFSGENINGKDPKTATDSHAKVENKNVCRRFKTYFFSKLLKINKIPNSIVINEDERKLWLSSRYMV